MLARRLARGSHRSLLGQSVRDEVLCFSSGVFDSWIQRHRHKNKDRTPVLTIVRNFRPRRKECFGPFERRFFEQMSLRACKWLFESPRTCKNGRKNVSSNIWNASSMFLG